MTSWFERVASWFERVASWFTGPPSGRLDSKQLPSICFLGKGLSGFVYETKWKGDKYARKDFPLGSERSNFVFQNEARSLLDLDHRNIVRCFGYTVGDSSCSLVQEYVDDDLLNTMQRRIEAQRNKNSSSSSSSYQLRIVDGDEIKRLLEVRNIPGVDEGSSETPGKCTDPFDLSEALDIISQIAVGMWYLHNNGIVHGDLKPKNVLLCSESGAMKVKVADFGLIKTKKRIRLVSKRTQHLGILMWKAPERFEELMGPLTEDSDDPLTDSDTDEVSEDLLGLSKDLISSEVEILKMADVYSFGLTCSHILVGKLLYPDFSLTKLREQRMHGFRPELPSSTCPDYLKYLIYSCLEFEPSKRPTFSNICFLLEDLGRFPRELEKGTVSRLLLNGAINSTTFEKGSPQSLSLMMFSMTSTLLFSVFEGSRYT